MTDKEIEMALETIALVLEDLKKTQEKQQATITAIEEALKEHAMQEVQRLGQEIEQERTWVELTDEDRNDCLVEADPCECLATPEAQELMRCVEAKSRSKNQ